MTDRWTIIANPAAGRGRAARGLDRAVAHLRAAGVTTDIHLTRGPGHAGELAAAAAQRGVDRLIACGGDGTVTEMLPVAVEAGVTLGLLPLGTGNDLARALGIPRGAAAGARNLLEGQPSAIDVTLVNGHPCATVTSLGLDADVSQAVRNRRLPCPGTAAYLVAALSCLRRFTPFRVGLTGDFGHVESKVLLVAGANTSSYGGGMRIAPGADPRDGLLDLCVVRAVPRRQVVAFMPRLFWGGHLRHPAVTVLRSRRVDMEILSGGERDIWADGEPASRTPATLEVLPRALRILLPKRR